MDVYYTGQFVLPLPEGHRFPMAKYHMLRDRLVAEYQGIELKTASPASDGMLALTRTKATGWGGSSSLMMVWRRGTGGCLTGRGNAACH